MELPRAWQYTTVTNISTTIEGITVALTGVSAGGVEIPNSGISSSDPLVHLQISPREQEDQWRIALVSVTDEAGRAVSQDRSPLYGRTLARTFRFPEGMTNANFVFALHKPRQIEFLSKASVP